jgi:hypothetical protein
MNLTEVTQIGLPPDPSPREFAYSLTLIQRSVTNSHLAVSPAGVWSAFQVLSVIVPSDPPVARTPMWEYSRS